MVMLRVGVEGLTIKLSNRRWQRASTEADDIVKPVTHKTKTHSAVRCSAWLGVSFASE